MIQEDGTSTITVESETTTRVQDKATGKMLVVYHSGVVYNTEDGVVRLSIPEALALRDLLSRAIVEAPAFRA